MSLIQRSLQIVKNNKLEIKIRTMNTLANLCADNTENGFPFVKPEYLEWDYRKNLLVEELISHDPDFICLQEVERWDIVPSQAPSKNDINLNLKNTVMKVYSKGKVLV